MKSNIEIKAAQKLLALQDSAKSRGIEFNLTFSKVKQLLSRKTCYFTGVVFSEEVNSDNSRSIDRIDNNLGYIDSNVVACANKFNTRKGDLTLEEIIILYNKCIKARKKKK